ncbi:DNA repair exonuclease [Aquabacterium sp. A7-Y]|uniref:metallophosphoesterase family protein n=1 Tax=Aquabacterium sp. A7-Y TaxID=1349605 RepID=UPI00223D1642|nr:DNA repair exonuclease [Aquabacterium sp. A7-Y]MCW7542060.1 DNA repair exonuclease [Aquabacterium sp. A7-Y]
MPRFLHTADWQIGRHYGQFDPDDAVPLAEARFAAVERLAMLASEHRVDAVLVAGDVFDAQTVSDRTVRRLFNALAAYAGPWILLPGNHDAALAESVWSRALRLAAVPANVHLALEPGVLDFAERGFVALAAPLTQRHTYSDLTAWFDSAETAPGLLRIGLAHGSVQGILAEDIDSANPIAAERAARARLDYLALGDWHGTRRIDARTWYSGTPEPDRFKANESGQALRVEIDAPGAEPQVSALASSRYRWRSLSEILNVESDVDRLLENLAQAGPDDVLELTLQGRTDLAGHRRLAQAVGELQARVRSVRSDLSGLRLLPTEDDIAALQADGYLGAVIAELREQQQQGERADVARDALALLAGFLAERQPAGGGTR